MQMIENSYYITKLIFNLIKVDTQLNLLSNVIDQNFQNELTN